MGGLEPARDYVLRAMAAGPPRRHRQQAAAQPPRRGAVGGRARARGAAALRGGRRRRRAGDPRAAGVAGRRPRRAHPRDRQRHDELHPHADGRDGRGLRRRAGRGPAAGLRRGRPDRRRQRPRRRREDGDPRPAGLRHAGARRPGRPTRASSTSPPTTWPTRASSGWGSSSSARPSASTAGSSVRVHPAFLYAGHPLASVSGPFNAVTIESPAITEITLSGPGRRRPADGERRARRRHQRDDPARLDARRRPSGWRSSTTSSRPSTCTSRSPTGPACWPRSPSCSGCRARRSRASCSGGWARTRGS